MAQLGAAWVLLSSASASPLAETRVTSLVCYTNTVVLWSCLKDQEQDVDVLGLLCFFCVLFLPKSCKSDLHLFYQLLMLKNMILHPPSPQFSRAQSPAGSLLCWISQDD